MSRYAARLEGKSLNWGYDNPLKEYFIQLWDDNDVETPVFCVGNVAPLTLHPDFPKKMNWSKDEITSLYESYAPHIPDTHIEAIKKGLPF